MTLPIRSFLALSILVIVLAACGTTVAAPVSEKPAPSEPADPTPEPAQPTKPVATPKPSQAPKPTTAPTPAERQVAGTITVYPGIASGPGGTIAEALANPPSGDVPALVNGVIFRDTDGRIYLASSVSDATVASFDAPMLEVLGYPNDGESWDMKNAELLGLEEANGIVFKADAQLLGTIEAR